MRYSQSATDVEDANWLIQQITDGEDIPANADLGILVHRIEDLEHALLSIGSAVDGDGHYKLATINNIIDNIHVRDEFL